jgi:hypothetical protein
VDPKRGLAHQARKVGDKRQIDWIILPARMDAERMRSMVRDDDGRAANGRIEPLAKPPQGIRVKRYRVLRYQGPAVDLDRTKIDDAPQRMRNRGRQALLAVKPEIGP